MKTSAGLCTVAGVGGEEEWEAGGGGTGVPALQNEPGAMRVLRFGASGDSQPTLHLVAD